MAKTSKIVRNEQRKVLVAKYAERRNALRVTVKSATATDDEKQAAYAQMRKLPRDSSPTRIRNRCAMTGRPVGFSSMDRRMYFSSVE